MTNRRRHPSCVRPERPAIDIGRRSPAFPVTPPYVRVRIRRFRDLSPMGPEFHDANRQWRLRRCRIPVGLHPIRLRTAQPKLIGWRMAIHEIRAATAHDHGSGLRPNRTTMPSADFCRAIKEPHGPSSRDFTTPGRPPEVSSTAFRTQPPNLQPVLLMDMRFAVIRPLAQHRMPQIRFLYIGSYVCSTLPSDPISR